MFRLQLRCSGGTSNLGVDAGLRGRLSFSLHANGFEGWCSPRCFDLRAASNRSCGNGVSSLVRGSGLRGAYRPSNAHEDGRPVALKTDLACRNGPASLTTKMDQPLRLPKWTCELRTALEDPPGGPTYVTMDFRSRQLEPKDFSSAR